MDRYALTLLIAAAATGCGALIAAVVPRPNAATVLLAAVACCMIGVIVGWAVASAQAARRGKEQHHAQAPTLTRDDVTSRDHAKPRHHAQQDVLPPSSIPFRSRLAKFTKQKDSEVMKEIPFKSSMPFWSAVKIGVGVAPKSGEIIRRYLNAIRRSVRRGRRRH